MFFLTSFVIESTLYLLIYDIKLAFDTRCEVEGIDTPESTQNKTTFMF